MTKKQLDQIGNMSAVEIAELIMFEDMTAEDADQLVDAIPADQLSAVMAIVE